MKAVAICPRCNKRITTNCKPCIEYGEDVHKCKGMKHQDVVENIKWKKFPETEEEIMEEENET